MLDELGSGASPVDTAAVAHTLPGAVIDCGLPKIRENDSLRCNTDLFPCLFEISKGT